MPPERPRRRGVGSEGGVEVLVGIATDITDRKRMEEALRESRASLEKAQEVAQVGSWVSAPDRAGRLAWSKETLRIFGLDAAGFDGRVETFFARVHAEDVEAVRAASEAALRGDTCYSIDHRIVRPDGSIRWVHEEAEVVRDATGRALQMIGTVQDITERRQLEAQLLQSQKMEAIGRLAGGVAHDFNNLLGVILGYGDRLLVRLPELERREAQEIVKAANRAATLTRQLLAFSRKQVLEPKVLDLNLVVQDAEGMLRRIIGEDVHLVTVFRRDLGHVKADPGQLQQVILNLVVNARDAMPGGGNLTLETDDVELGESYAAEYVEVQPGRYVMLAVTDTGHGMDVETLAHVFEPFFTTKPAGKGTGLGLSTVYGIVKQSGGHVAVYSEPGLGTTFRIYLPRMEQGMAADGVEAREAGPPTGSETILLVEDEESLRELTREVLEEGGYRVLPARSGAQALEVASCFTGPIQLVLTDVVMPGMSGRELVRQLGGRRPETRALFMSGYTDDALGQRGMLDSGTAFVGKPFKPDALLRKVREVLDAPVA